MVLLPRWMNLLHGALMITGFCEILAKSAGQPARRPADTWPIKRIFSDVICLWAPVWDFSCMIRTAWIYFLQVLAMSKEIVADAIATKRAKMMHEIFILTFCFAFGELIKLKISCWWWIVFSSVYIFDFSSLATPSGKSDESFLKAQVIFTNEKKLLNRCQHLYLIVFI